MIRHVCQGQILPYRMSLTLILRIEFCVMGRGPLSSRLLRYHPVTNILGVWHLALLVWILMHLCRHSVHWPLKVAILEVSLCRCSWLQHSCRYLHPHVAIHRHFGVEPRIIVHVLLQKSRAYLLSPIWLPWDVSVLVSAAMEGSQWCPSLSSVPASKSFGQQGLMQPMLYV